MDPNQLFAWIVGLNCAFGLFRLIRARRPYTDGWIAIFAVLLAALGGLYFLAPAWMGILSGIAWAALVPLPGVLMWALNRFLIWGWFTPALFAAYALVALHPFDGWRCYPDFVRLCRALHLGELEQAEELTTHITARPSPLGLHALVLSVALTDDWERLCRWLETRPDRDQLMRDPTALSAYLSSLGRVGRVEDMLRTYRELGTRAASTTVNSAIVKLGVAVQSGSVDIARLLLEGPLSMFPRAVRTFYIAEAEQACGRATEAEEHLREVLSYPGLGASMRIRAERLLEKPIEVRHPEAWSPEARATLEALRRDLDHEREFGLAPHRDGRRPVVTWGIAIALLCVYALEMWNGDPTDTQNLIDLGALVIPAEAASGEWWRPISAAFLHYGPWHLALNLLGLLMLGRWLEAAWPKGRFLFCYLLALFASTSLLPFFWRLEPNHVVVLVGASGGILGLLGALLGRSIVGQLRGNSGLVRRQRSFLLLIVVLQMAFDFSVPQVSSTCHLIGLCTGLLFGLIVTARERPARRAEPA